MDPLVLPYSPSQIVRAEQLLGLRRKSASTTCERAYWPVNVNKRNRFWRCDYPRGRNNVRTKDQIDMDEDGFKIESTNPNYGKTVSWLRCYLEGQFNRDKKLNLMMAISADPAYNMEWHDMWPQEEGGTDVYRVCFFFSASLTNLPLITQDGHSVLQWII